MRLEPLRASPPGADAREVDPPSFEGAGPEAGEGSPEVDPPGFPEAGSDCGENSVWGRFEPDSSMFIRTTESSTETFSCISVAREDA